MEPVWPANVYVQVPLAPLSETFLGQFRARFLDLPPKLWALGLENRWQQQSCHLAAQ